MLVLVQTRLVGRLLPFQMPFQHIDSNVKQPELELVFQYGLLSLLEAPNPLCYSTNLCFGTLIKEISQINM